MSFDLATELTRDQRRSLALGRAVAAKVQTDPRTTIELAKTNLAHLKRVHPSGQASFWLSEWQRVLDGPLVGVVEALTSTDELSRELRQNSPFAGVLTSTERQDVLSAFRAEAS